LALLRHEIVKKSIYNCDDNGAAAAAAVHAADMLNNKIHKFPLSHCVSFSLSLIALRAM
jgi:hypothetical protein